MPLTGSVEERIRLLYDEERTGLRAPSSHEQKVAIAFRTLERDQLFCVCGHRRWEHEGARNLGPCGDERGHALAVANRFCLCQSFLKAKPQP